MSTLTEFLLARIAEDEGWAQKIADHLEPGAELQFPLTVRDGNHVSITYVTPYRPARVLAECDAKRRIVALHQEAERESLTDAVAYLRAALVAEAAVYANHQDYDERWRPDA